MKRLKSTLEVRTGFNLRIGVQDFFETRVYREKLIRSLYENTRMFLFEKKSQNTALLNAVDAFVRSQVFIDAVYVRTERNPETGAITGVFGSNMSDGKHVVRNGLSQNIRDRRGINSIRILGVIPENVMVVVFVSDYLPEGGVHRNHAVSAFKHGDVLFCFNPWGEAAVGRQDIPDSMIWETLRKEYRCAMKVVYTGPNFQAQNTQGACLGLSVDFGAYMYNHLFLTGLQGVSRYNTLVPQLFDKYVGAFGNHRSKCRLSDVMTRLTSNTVPVKNNKRNNVEERFRKGTNKNINILQNVLTLSNKNKSILREENNSILVQKLREHNPSLRSVHGNRILADVRRYRESGNLPSFPKRNVAVPMNF